jgi:peptidoglycan/xylan/chitin deacetylase (PgdA/CDA1 family)
MNMSPSLIVNYHYCIREEENPYLARTAVAPAVFIRQVEQLACLQDDKGIAPLVTFDDGTCDVWRNAVPVLVRLGVPFILFVCTLPLIERRLLNVTKIHLLQAKLGLDTFRARFMAALQLVERSYELDDPVRFNLGRIYRYDIDEVRQFKLLLNVKLPYPLVTQLLDVLFESEFGPQSDAVQSIYMSADEIQCARDSGAQIGLHTHSHFMLGRLDPAQQVGEIAICHNYLSDLLGRQSFELSYPYGVPGTWNDHTKEIMVRFGVSRAYTLGRQIHDPSCAHDSFEIPRFDVNDVFDHGGSMRPVLFE